MSISNIWHGMYDSCALYYSILVRRSPMEQVRKEHSIVFFVEINKCLYISQSSDVFLPSLT